MKPKTKNEAKWLDDYWLYKPYNHVSKLKKKIKRRASKVRRRAWKQSS